MENDYTVSEAELMKQQQINMFQEEPVAYQPLDFPAPPEELFLPGVSDAETLKDIHTFAELEHEAKNCTRCGLRETCQQVVFGVGPATATMMVVGEGPGQDEDLKGEPFVGRAGQLLDKILLAAELKREEIYIANVVKCRPPGNRLPLPNEVKACRVFLEKQIRLIRPKLIVCLGAMATQTVIDPKAKITKTRGIWFTRNHIRMIATFHPAALLRNPDYKRPTWEDFKLIRDVYRQLTEESGT
jgi:DNA polymerase